MKIFIKSLFVISILSSLSLAALSIPQDSFAQVCIVDPGDGQCPGSNELQAESECNAGMGCPGDQFICCGPPSFCDSVNILVYPECTFRFLAQSTVLVITALLVVGALWLIYVFFKSDFNYIIHGDSTEKTQQARMAMIWSTIGVFVLASVYAIFRVIIDIVPGLSDLISFG